FHRSCDGVVRVCYSRLPCALWPRRRMARTRCSLTREESPARRRRSAKRLRPRVWPRTPDGHGWCHRRAAHRALAPRSHQPFFPQSKAVLAAGYSLAGVTAILLCIGTSSLALLAVIFMLAGLYIGTEEPLEDSLSAEIVPKEQHGMAFGTLAAVNAVGDFLSSLL